jgi:glycosyl transferase family 25
MKAYMISLNESTEKIAYLKSFGIDTILVKGVNGKTVQIEDIIKRVSNKYKNFGPKSAIGCAISHMNTWKMFLETDDKYAIIFEDDVVLEDNFVDKLEISIKEVPEDYDILYLGCTGCDNNQKINIVKFTASFFIAPNTFNKHQQITDNIGIPSLALSTHAYIVSRNGATKLLKYLDGKLYHHIDFCIQKLVLDNKIESYSVTPRIAYQTSTENTPSENVSSNYPVIATSILDKIYVDKLYRAQYLFSVSFMRIGDFNINTFTVIFFLIGFICILKKINIRKVTIGFLIFSSPDLIMVRSKADLQVILFNYFILILPFILKRSITTLCSLQGNI